MIIGAAKFVLNKTNLQTLIDELVAVIGVILLGLLSGECASQMRHSSAAVLAGFLL